MYRLFLTSPLLVVVAVLLLSSCATTAKFGENQPAALTYRTGGTYTISVTDWRTSDQLVLLPGGPYAKQKIQLPVPAKLLAMDDQYVVTIDESSELRILDFSISPVRQVVSVPLTDIATALAVRDHQVFVGFENQGIWQFDISQPKNIKKRAEFIKAKAISRIKFANNRLYALSEKRTIMEFDITLPDTDTQKSRFELKKKLQLPGLSHDFEVLESYIVLLGPAYGLATIDPAFPDRILVQRKLQGSQSQLLVKKHIAYIADGDGGLVLVDISSKDRLTWLGSHNKLDSIEKVLVTDSQAYVIDRNLRVASIDTGNKTLPITGSFYMPDSSIYDAVSAGADIYLATAQGVEQVSFPDRSHAQISNEGINQGGTRRAFIDNHIAYVADWFSGLHLYDISNPQKLQHISNFHTPGSSKGVVVADGYAYVGDDDHGLQIIDVSNPQQPVKVSEIQTTGLAYTLKKVGNLVYLADHRGGFHIIDVSDVKNPRMLASYDTPGKSWAIDIAGKYAFVADDSTGLLVFDVSDVTKPVQIGQFDPGGYAEDVAIKNGFAYVSFFDKGFYIVDINDPAKPVEISHIDIPGNARSVVIDGNYAYVAGWESGLSIIDIANKQLPHIVGNYDTKGSAWGVDVYNNHAFIWDWWGGVKVVNVADPKSPSLAGKYHTRGTILNLRQKGNYIYTANGSGGVQVFDIRNVLNPIWTTGTDIPGSVRDVWPSDSSDTVYAVSDQGELYLFDISDPFYIRRVGQYQTGGQAKLVRAYNNIVFVANDRGGLISFDASNPARLEKIQDIAISVKDMWVDNGVMFVASEKRGLVALDINEKGQLKQRMKTIDDNAEHVVAYQQLVVSANDQREIFIWQFKNNSYYNIAHLAVGSTILDLHIANNTLYANTREKGLLVFDITAPSNPRLNVRYPSTDLHEKFLVHHDAVFFGGTHTIASIQLLPAISWKLLTGNELEFTVPADLPVGNYHLELFPTQGSQQLWPDALTMSLPKRSKPKMTQEQFEQLLKQYRSGTTE